jgi:hypothetical protein
LAQGPGGSNVTFHDIKSINKESIRMTEKL